MIAAILEAQCGQSFREEFRRELGVRRSHIEAASQGIMYKKMAERAGI